MPIVNEFLQATPDSTPSPCIFKSAVVLAFIEKTHGYGGQGHGFVGIALNDKFVAFMDRENTIEFPGGSRARGLVEHPTSWQQNMERYCTILLLRRWVLD